jgi:II/X family phage/plasmid replication protein
VFSMSPDGDVEWHVDKAKKVQGSHSSQIIMKSFSDQSVWISGNPTKFLQGHNIFGTNDIQYLMGKFIDKLLKMPELSLTPTDSQLLNIKQGFYRLSRVDMNESWMLASMNEVLSWIRAAGSSARLKHRGAGQYAKDTLYFGKHSRRWALKCYSKGNELLAKGHHLPPELMIAQLIEYAEKALRLELVMRQLQLKDMGLDVLANWTPETAKLLLQSTALDNLEITDNMPIPDDVLAALPTRLKGVYSLWLDGNDLRAIIPKNTFYRYRRAMLPFGVDISLVQETERKSNVIPLIRYLEAIPAGIPDWAYELGLVA